MPDHMCCPSTVQFSRNLLNDEISSMSNGHLASSSDITFDIVQLENRKLHHGDYGCSTKIIV